MNSKKLLLSYAVSASLLFFISSCEKSEQEAPPPTFTTHQPEFISGNSAVIESEVSSPDGSEIVARGVCWSETRKPTIANARTFDGKGAGTFRSTITGLHAATTYYLRAYAITGTANIYGNEITLTTGEFINITTSAITDITVNSAVVSGAIAPGGDSSIIARGICWSDTPFPTVAGHHIEQGSGSGDFAATIEGLVVNTRYYARAYAVNAEDTVYGNDMPFVTSSVDIDGNIYHAVIIGSQIWMVENLKVTRYRNGDALPEILDDNLWTTYEEGAFCDYANNPDTGKVYGHLYNYPTITDPRNICPEGWHLPSNSEWSQLEKELGGNNVAGGKMKQAGTAR